MKKLAQRFRDIVHLYARNWLIWLFVVLALGIVLFSLTPNLLLTSSPPTTRTVSNYLTGMNLVIGLTIILVGLTTITQDIRHGTIKTYFTRPCSPRLWLFSHLISLIGLLFISYLAHLIVVVLALSVWSISVGMPIVYVFLYSFFCGVIVISISSAFAVWVHPILAGVLTFFSWDLIWVGLLDIVSSMANGLEFLNNTVSIAIIHTVLVVLPSHFPHVIESGPGTREPIEALISKLEITSGLHTRLWTSGLYSLTVFVAALYIGSMVLERRDLQ